jgi:Domain of unknown function (DUF4190)
MAITSLVLGIAAFPGICCYGVPGIALGVTAVVLGRMALRKIRASGGTLSGDGLAQAGWITGLVAGSLGLLYALFTVGLLVFSIVASFISAQPTPTP